MWALRVKYLILLGFTLLVNVGFSPYSDLNTGKQGPELSVGNDNWTGNSHYPLTSLNNEVFDSFFSQTPAVPFLESRMQPLLEDPKQVLEDPANRVNDDFAIPEGLKQRVSFWFDIYTKYGRSVHVIHHVLYPWLVYSVIDRSDDIANGRGPLWLRIDRADKYAAAQLRKTRAALARLAKSPKALNAFERNLVQKLKAVPGPRRKVYKEASLNIRSQMGQKDFFISGLRYSNKYLPHLEEIFASKGLPVDITRLPFVESSFNVKAYSKVGASGIWQVMPRTGQEFGRVTTLIDERNSPLKATAMAANLLKNYKKALGSWPLALTSYNHGIGNIRVAIRKARSNDLVTIIRRYHAGDFRFASANFYACFLAALHAERYSEMIFPRVARDAVHAYEVVKIVTPISLKNFISQNSISLDDLLGYNLDLQGKSWKKITLPRGYSLHVPYGRANELVEKWPNHIKSFTSVSQTENSTNSKYSIN